MQLSRLIAANKDRWAKADFSIARMSVAYEVAEKLCEEKAKAVYEHIAHETGVPWWVIALIHEREASQSWKANIANGQRWDRRTTITPKGRGPFHSFVIAAVDALTNCAPHAARWKDWSAGGALTLLELYNGEGYENYHHMASPYLWAGSDQYRRGKYVADGHFDPDAVDHQLGCAILLKAMMEIDESILPDHPNSHPPVDDQEEDAPPDVPPSEPTPAQEPSLPEEVPASNTPKHVKKISWMQKALVSIGLGGLVGQSDDAAQRSASDMLQQLHDTGMQGKQIVHDFGLAPIVEHMLNWHTLMFVAIIGIAGATIYFHWKATN